MHVALALSRRDLTEDGGRSACCAHSLTSALPAGQGPRGAPAPSQARSPQLTVALAVMRHVAAAWIVPSPRHSGVIGNNRVGPR